MNHKQHPAVQTITRRTHFLIIIELKMDPLCNPSLSPNKAKEVAQQQSAVEMHPFWAVWEAGSKKFLEGTIPRRW